ncbi:MAG: dihydroorotate dehydrogenase electron transfer subunit, partial [Chloroflexia bacterium]|nr:dihydroorotate dehydrogenase electron transfer subunit [Chloroflexia bacterium]
MACGVGACLGCVVETIRGIRTSCVDGPVFEMDELVWS